MDVSEASGCFYIDGYTDRYGSGSNSSSHKMNGVFNASRSVTTSPENRPVNISAIPLIVAA